MPTEQEIREALRPAMDSEIGMSVVDLGMIRHVKVDDEGGVAIGIVLIAPFCSLDDFVVGQVQSAAGGVVGVKEAKVTLLQERWDPSWTNRSGR